jgi:hypothetical protein
MSDMHVVDSHLHIYIYAAISLLLVLLLLLTLVTHANSPRPLMRSVVRPTIDPFLPLVGLKLQVGANWRPVHEQEATLLIEFRRRSQHLRYLDVSFGTSENLILFLRLLKAEARTTPSPTSFCPTLVSLQIFSLYPFEGTLDLRLFPALQYVYCFAVGGSERQVLSCRTASRLRPTPLAWDRADRLLPWSPPPLLVIFDAIEIEGWERDVDR